jgi:hypothetical protein
VFGKGVLLLLVLSLALVGWTKHRDRLREQDRLAVVASTIVGHKVGVHCPNVFKKLVYANGEAGTVKFDASGRPANYTDLAPETCDSLRNVGKADWSCFDTRTCGYDEFQVAWALHTLAHEAFHMRGFGAEGVTECYAMQTTAQVAIALGIPSRRAAQIQRWVWDKGYPNEPEEYSSPFCANGTQLDLHPGSSVWP